MISIGPLLSIAADRTIDELGKRRRDLVRTQSEPRHDPRSKALHHDIGLCKEGADRLPARRFAEVGDHAVFSRVEDVEQPRKNAGGVTVGRLDLHNLGTHRAQHHRGVGPGKVLREVDHSGSAQRRHGSSLRFFGEARPLRYP